MKMKLMDRLLIALFSLIGVAISALLVYNLFFAQELNAYISSAWDVDFPMALHWFADLSLTLPGQIGLGAVALVLLAWSVKIFSIAIKHEREKAETSVSVQNTENGSVRISISALDTLISHALEHQEGIKQVKSRIINHEDSVSVAIEMSLTSDVNIPNITMLLQRSVKNYIEEYSGIAVREITVLINSIVEVVPLPLALENKHNSVVETYEAPAETFVEPATAQEEFIPQEIEQPEAENEAEEAVEVMEAVEDEGQDASFTLNE